MPSIMKAKENIPAEPEKKHIFRLSNSESNKLTRECLTTALVYLMGEKAFDKISITELVKRSGVSRTAFYRNYTTKEDIIKEIAGEVKKAIADQLKRPEYETDREKWYQDCFQIVADNEKTIRLLQKAGLSINTLFEGGSIVDDLIPSTTWMGHYCKLAAEAAIGTTLVTWFESGMKETPEEMARLCCLIHNKIMA